MAAKPALAAETGEFLTAVQLVPLLGGLALGGALAGYFALRRLRVYRDAISAVGRPRQIIDGAGRVIFASDSLGETFGDRARPLPELLKARAADDESREKIERLEVIARRGRKGAAEIRLRPGAAGDGQPEDQAAVRQDIAVYPLKPGSGHAVWLVDDMQLRQRTEHRVEAERRRFMALLEPTTLGGYLLDGQGCIVAVNQRLADWLGWPKAALEGGGRRLRDLFAEAAPDLLAAHAPAPREAGVPQGEGGAIRFKTASGEGFDGWVTQAIERGEDGTLVRTYGLVRNLTRERAPAEALARAERRLDDLFQRAPVGLALVDAGGVITECNEAIRDLAGLEGERAAGRRLVELVAEDGRPLVTDLMERAAKGEAGHVDLADQDGRSVEVTLAGSGGVTCALFLTPLGRAPEKDSAEAGGFEAGGFIAHFIDTTEQKSLERQFVQSQKMQAVGQLAGGIAHDFNNLLTAMIGFSDLLLLRHRPGDQSFADIMQIKQNANRAANLVRQLLAFSRQQTLQPKVLDLTDILAELSHLLRRLIGENIELNMIHGRDLGRVKADQGQLEQVIINLAVNARDAMPGGGKLTIQTKNVTLRRVTKRKGETLPAGGYTQIQTIDTGCGVTRENLDRIFDPFFTTKEVGAGTGLGLSTVYGIVRQTGGFVFVESEVDKGTTFSILLPHNVQSESEAEEAETQAEESRDLTGVGTLLLVEDEDAVRAFSARALRNKGYDVLEARSGEAALELLNEKPGDIDLLITDVVMPRIDGPTLVRQVRSERPDLKVIFISGYAEDAFRKRLDRDAGIHFLPKPFSLKQLAGKVKEVMRENAA
ncbi:MAG: response regulator [Kiloniellales bacterium]|nr:response regulator [Kiloniellales bacterium]